MRNLQKYPITLSEAIAAVERALVYHNVEVSDAESEGRGQPVGTVHGAALQDAINRLKRLEFAAT